MFNFRHFCFIKLNKYFIQSGSSFKTTENLSLTTLKSHLKLKSKLKLQRLTEFYCLVIYEVVGLAFHTYLD